jgi:hypothetical protein
VKRPQYVSDFERRPYLVTGTLPQDAETSGTFPKHIPQNPRWLSSWVKSMYSTIPIPTKPCQESMLSIQRDYSSSSSFPMRSEFFTQIALKGKQSLNFEEMIWTGRNYHDSEHRRTVEQQ